MVQNILRISGIILEETPNAKEDMFEVATCDFAFKNSSIMRDLAKRGTAISQDDEDGIKKYNDRIIELV